MDYEIIVIDSGSFDGSCEMIKQLYPEIRFIQSDRNIGFAKSNNIAFMESHGSNILFLNPDTEIENGALHSLMRSIDSIPNAGAVGACLFNSDGSVQSTCIRAFPTILNQILDTEFLKNKFPLSKLWGMAELYNYPIQPVKVDAVSGACLMVKRSAFKGVEMFSTDYFMYSEDIDLCFKLKAAGWDTYYIPGAIVTHHGGGSSSNSGAIVFSDVMMLESRLRFFRKTRSHLYAGFYRLSMLCVSLIRILLLLLFYIAFKSTKTVNYLKKAILKWKARLRWTLGLESWVKNY